MTIGLLVVLLRELVLQHSGFLRHLVDEVEDADLVPLGQLIPNFVLLFLDLSLLKHTGLPTFLMLLSLLVLISVEHFLNY